MLCRLYQWRIERRIDEGRSPWEPALQRHLDHCQTCRDYARKIEQIGSRLSQHPPVLIPSSLQPLNDRILRSFFENEASARIEVFHTTRPACGAKCFAGAMAAGLLITAGVLMFTLRQSSRFEPIASPISLVTQSIQTPLPVVASWSEKPMRTEIEQLKTDAQRAITFLINCTPAQVEPLENRSKE